MIILVYIMKLSFMLCGWCWQVWYYNYDGHSLDGIRIDINRGCVQLNIPFTLHITDID